MKDFKINFRSIFFETKNFLRCKQVSAHIPLLFIHISIVHLSFSSLYRFVFLVYNIAVIEIDEHFVNNMKVKIVLRIFLHCNIKIQINLHAHAEKCVIYQNFKINASIY